MIAPYLKSRCLGEFAFAIDNLTVTYAEPLVVGSVRWPAEVVLMQHYAANKVNLFNRRIGIHAQSVSTMGSGMMAHLGVKHDLLQHVTASTNAGSFNFVKITNTAVVSGSSDWGVAVDAGEPFGVDLTAQGAYLHRLYLMAALRLIFRHTAKIINLSRYSSIKRDAGHNIGALIVAKTGRVIAIGLNSGTINTTHHAETNAMQAYAKSGKAFPSQAFVYTTLKPCDMCAAMIAQLMPDSTVVYIQNDPRANGILAPTGGMHALANMNGAKQIRLHGQDLSKTGHDLDPQLNNTTTNKQHGTQQNDHFYYLTNILDDHAIFGLMESAQRGLARKANKYTQGDHYGLPVVTPSHPEVVAVLEHLAAVVDFKMEYPPTNWNELRKDFPDHFMDM